MERRIVTNSMFLRGYLFFYIFFYIYGFSDIVV